MFDSKCSGLHPAPNQQNLKYRKKKKKSPPCGSSRHQLEIYFHSSSNYSCKLRHQMEPLYVSYQISPSSWKALICTQEKNNHSTSARTPLALLFHILMVHMQWEAPYMWNRKWILGTMISQHCGFIHQISGQSFSHCYYSQGSATQIRGAYKELN